MHFEFGFYSSLLLIFFVHGLVYAVLLFKKGFQNESAADKWLALFVILCVLYIAPWMLGFGGWYDTQPLSFFLIFATKLTISKMGTEGLYNIVNQFKNKTINGTEYTFHHHWCSRLNCRHCTG